MSTSHTIDATVRTNSGTAHTRRLRHTGYIPAVVYGAGKDTISISLEHRLIATALKDKTIYETGLTLNIDGTATPVTIKAIERHHTKPQIMHVDFVYSNP